MHQSLRDVSDISSAIKNIESLDLMVLMEYFQYVALEKSLFQLVEPNKNGSLKLSKSLSNTTIVSRQNAPKVYEHVASICFVASISFDCK